MTNSDLKTKLTALEFGNDAGFGALVTSWHRNPDGLAAVAEIERLEKELAFLRGVDLRKLLDGAEARIAELEGPPTPEQIKAAARMLLDYEPLAAICHEFTAVALAGAALVAAQQSRARSKEAPE